jgi:ABC-type nitrate/sulfonate/bicarbonate transport system substrate-binding protein
MNISRIYTIILSALAVLLCFAGCASGETDLKSVTFMAGFKPQANLPFVATYVAEEKGYFEEMELDVDIRHSTGEHLNLLMAGEVDFTTVDANSVLKRRADPGLPIVAIALFGQRGQQAFLALSDSGINAPKDWEGKTFGYKVSIPPDYLAILEAEGVDRSRIQEVRVGFDPRILTEGQVDVLASFKSNEPNIIRGMGFDVNMFDAADYGVPTLGLTYIVQQDMIDEDSDTVERFLRATMKGMEFAVSNTEETLDIVLKYAEGADREHMRFMLEAEFADATSPITDANGLGWMTEDQWQEFHDSLIKYGALPGSQDVSSAFTDEFLEDIYEDGKVKWP